MAVTARALGDAFAAIAGRDGLRDDPGACAAAAIDGRPPRWIVRPASIDQLSRVVALAHDEGLTVVPRGGGSALELGFPASRLDLIVDLAGLDRVIEYNPDDLTVTVEAGLAVGALAAQLAPRRQFLPLDPPGWRGRTLGGVAATNASGPLRARYGTMRDLLLGVRFVQADGVVTWGGSKVVKSVSGYDVPKLMIGALGTLGVLAELTLRLHPLPDAEGAWLVRLPSAEAAQAFVQRLLDSPLQPNRVEFFSAPTLASAGTDAASAGADATSAGVAVSTGTVADAVREQGERLEAMARSGGGQIAPVTDAFWSRTEQALATGEGESLLHVTTLADRLADTVRAITEAVGADAARAHVAIGGCAALGTFRARVAGASVAEAAALTTRLRGRVAELGGSVVIARGPAALRRAVDPWGPIDPGPLAIMRALRDEFDPKRVLNPGRFVGGL
jgi:glycolate oxidase FAD binding subunit